MRLVGPVLAALVLTGTPVAAPSAAQAARPGDFRITAHRGAPSERATENTIRAMRRAVRLKASALETDVRMTKDGRPVLMHDPTLDRTTTCRGRVSERSMRSLRRRCRGEQGGERVPTLAALLRLADRRHVNVLLELKGDRWSRVEVGRVVSVVTRAGMVRRVTAMSFHRAPLRRVEAAEPALRTTFLARRWAQVDDALRFTDGVTLGAGLLTRGNVAAVRAAGGQVLARRANNPARWRQLKRLDVGDVVTDRISRYRRWLRR